MRAISAAARGSLESNTSRAVSTSSPASRARFRSPDPLPTGSAQPATPHGHAGPSLPTGRWPTSPAPPNAPLRTLPSTTMPEPTPVPTVTVMDTRAPRPAPAACSASAAQLASLSITTRRPSERSSDVRRGKLAGRFTFGV